MTLNQFAAEKRIAIFDDLQKGQDPREGFFDPAILREGRAKGSPQMGSTRFEPHQIVFEFIYPNALGAATILEVSLESPERIVFLPVPSWVVENIWQGEISGSYHFQSEGDRLVHEFHGELTAEGNTKWFEAQAPKRRE